MLSRRARISNAQPNNQTRPPSPVSHAREHTHTHSTLSSWIGKFERSKIHNSLNKEEEEHRKQDQSHKTAMEDSNAMTVEFLRARLLSERSVSRTAKERADELTKRVMELEEKLKFVTIQRKKAEKAAAEVLAILEHNGMSDLSEANESSSEQEGILCESEEGNNSTQEAEVIATMKPRKNKTELSGCDLEESPLIQRSLSWKSCTGNPDSVNKKKGINHVRKRNRNLASTGSSSRKQMGRSCRQIKRKESRSALAETRDKSFPDSQENGMATGCREVSNGIDNPEILNEGFMSEKVYSSCAVPGPLGSRSKESSGNGIDVDMERALEDQAQLIGRYEAEENAQREWEEKFKTNNICSPDSCEPGNQSDITDVTEEREMRTETVGPVHTILSPAARAKSEPEDACGRGKAKAETFSNGFLPTTNVDIGRSQDQRSNCSEIDTAQNGFSEFSFPCQENTATKANWKQEQDYSENNSSRPTSCGSSEHQLAQKFSTVKVGESFYGGSTRSPNELQVSVHNEASNGLGSVLESLKRAKLSLQHELSMSPSGSQRGSAVRVTESPISDIKPRDVTDFPGGCGGLFRIPTSPPYGIPPKTNFSRPSSESGSSLAKYYPDLGVERVATGDRYTTSHKLEMRSRSSNSRPYNDPYLVSGMALPPSNRYAYQSYADMVPRMPTSEEVSRPYSNTGPQMLLDQDHYSGNGNQYSSNMHRTL